MRHATRFTAFLMTATLLGGCVSLQTTTVSPNSEQQIRSSARAFTAALRDADAGRIEQVATVDPDARDLAHAVVQDSVAARHMHERLGQEFGFVEQKPGVVGSKLWVDQLEAAANAAPILREGDRVCLGPPATDGSIYLHKTDGDQWKVELVPTLVPESGGRQTVDDPAVLYRFGVSRAINEWMVGRMDRHEFHSKREFDQARNQFWIQYLTYTANGQDPQQHVLSTLPRQPHEEAFARD